MLLGTEDTMLRYDLTIESNHDWVHQIRGPAHPVYNSAPDITLELTYFINQMAQVKHQDILTIIEGRIGDFLKRTHGSFHQRTVEPFRDQHAIKLYYRIKLSDLELFNQELARGAQARLDAEFTKALEAKLSED